MANLEEFSSDEQLMILNIVTTDILVEKVAILTHVSAIDVKYALAQACKDLIESLSNNQLQEILESHRRGYSQSKELANKSTKVNNN